MKPTIVILGAGRLGSALAYLIRDAGYPVAAITAGHRETAVAISQASGIAAVFDNAAAAALGDVIILTVPDRVIPAVLTDLLRGKQLHSGQILLHTSGAATAEILAPAREFGVSVGSMHPLQSFADCETARETLAGSAFAVDGDPAAAAAASRLVSDLGGGVLNVPPAERALYHAAACMASNYLVALLHVSEQLLSRWTGEEQDAIQALLPLAAGSLRNVARQGTAAALTGPIVRGDAATVAQHLQVLPLELHPVYQSLGRVALELAGERVPAAERKTMAELLQESDM